MAKQKEVKGILSKRRIYLAIFICLGITGFVFWREWQNNDGAINGFNWSAKAFFYLFIALVLMAFRDLAFMIRIRILTDHQLSFRQSFNVIMLWEFASALSPGVVGGSAVALFILEKEKIPIGRSTALVIITLILDNLFYVIFIPLIFVFVRISELIPPDMSWLQEGELTLFWIAYTVIVAITLVLILSVFYSPKIIHFFIRLALKIPFVKNRFKAKADKFVEDIEVSSKVLRDKKFLYWIKLFAITTWSWVSRFLVINFVLFAFIEFGLLDHLIILARQFIMWLVMLITPTPGASGMAEFAFSELFADYVGAVGLSAAGLALIWRILSYYPYLVIGSILLPGWLRKK